MTYSHQKFGIFDERGRWRKKKKKKVRREQEAKADKSLSNPLRVPSSNAAFGEGNEFHSNRRDRLRNMALIMQQ